MAYYHAMMIYVIDILQVNRVFNTLQISIFIDVPLYLLPPRIILAFRLYLIKVFATLFRKIQSAIVLWKNFNKRIIFPFFFSFFLIFRFAH